MQFSAFQFFGNIIWDVRKQPGEEEDFDVASIICYVSLVHFCDSETVMKPSHSASSSRVLKKIVIQVISKKHSSYFG